MNRQAVMIVARLKGEEQMGDCSDRLFLHRDAKNGDNVLIQSGQCARFADSQRTA